MRFQTLGEAGYVQITEYIRICRELETRILSRVDDSSLAEKDIELCYIPILMPDEDLHRYPARSKYSRKENVLYCCPQLDYNRYQNGNAADRRAVMFDGLFESDKLMRRANFTEEEIEEFLAILEDAKRESVEQAPKGFLMPRWLDVLRTLARR